MENDDIKENEINNEEKKEEIKENKLNSNIEENKILELINNYFNGPNKDENNNIQDISYT